MDDTVTINQFGAVRMTVGRIISVSAMEGSDKLLRITADIGEEEPRTVLSGIRTHYLPDDLVGRGCIIVSNLAPRVMMGVESRGMLVCVSYTDDAGNDRVRIVEPPSDAPVGSVLS